MGLKSLVETMGIGGFNLQARMNTKSQVEIMETHTSEHSYDILGAGMLWKPKKARKFIKIPKNSRRIMF
jgi:hypothetical protein